MKPTIGIWSFLGCANIFPVLFAVPALIADEQPVTIAPGPVSGHIHPSICRTPDGTMLMVCKGGKGLVRSRSTDDGKTWEKPTLIATTVRRPEVIRKVKVFEVYPGTADTLPDGRILVTWNYIANDKATDGYYERALLYTLSKDQGRTWSDQRLIGPVDGKHLGAVRHNVLPWTRDRWLLPLRVGPPRMFHAETGTLAVFPLKGTDGKQHEFQQIIRTAKGSLLAMGPVLLRSTDQGSDWNTIQHFPAAASARDNLEGRHLTPLADGRILVTWGVGRQNEGIRYNLSRDDGQTWDSKSIVLLPDTPASARYYSPRTLQLDARHVGTVFMNRQGVHFLKVKLDRLTQ